ncbi:hypothetical protein SK128_009685 [Halocaridina rubra]|uniref:Uncharacterized protein n=1 Tax=Halocaridina rubra TaxID=373956 RepID=A0AAN8X6H3_HALRR
MYIQALKQNYQSLSEKYTEVTRFLNSFVPVSVRRGRSIAPIISGTLGRILFGMATDNFIAQFRAKSQVKTPNALMYLKILNNLIKKTHYLSVANEKLNKSINLTHRLIEDSANGTRRSFAGFILNVLIFNNNQLTSIAINHVTKLIVGIERMDVKGKLSENIISRETLVRMLGLIPHNDKMLFPVTSSYQEGILQQEEIDLEAAWKFMENDSSSASTGWIVLIFEGLLLISIFIVLVRSRNCVTDDDAGGSTTPSSSDGLPQSSNGDRLSSGTGRDVELACLETRRNDTFNDVQDNQRGQEAVTTAIASPAPAK